MKQMKLPSENELIWEFFDPTCDPPRMYEIYVELLKKKHAHLAMLLRHVIVAKVKDMEMQAWWKGVVQEEDFSDFS